MSKLARRWIFGSLQEPGEAERIAGRWIFGSSQEPGEAERIVWSRWLAGHGAADRLLSLPPIAKTSSLQKEAWSARCCLLGTCGVPSNLGRTRQQRGGDRWHELGERRQEVALLLCCAGAVAKTIEFLQARVGQCISGYRFRLWFHWSNIHAKSKRQGFLRAYKLYARHAPTRHDFKWLV
jgi:hypothetical protein